MSKKLERRDFLLASAGTVAAGAASGREGGSADEPNAPVRAPRAAEIPCGKVGKLNISRLILGGNLIAGYAHARDLVYVNRLFKEYNSRKKVFETLAVAEENGVNAIVTNQNTVKLISAYRKETGGKIQAITSVKCAKEDDLRNFDKAIQDGSDMVYLHGHVADLLVLAKKMDIIKKAVQHVRDVLEVPVGVGGHALEVPMACEEHKVEPDFYVQTFHQDCYWSAIPKEKRKPFCWYEKGKGDGHPYHDNMWCLDAPKTAEFMAKVKKPWIAFKILAAGAIRPTKAMPHAFANGADFIAVGMFDWQIEEDAAICRKAIEAAQKRNRPWYG